MFLCFKVLKTKKKSYPLSSKKNKAKKKQSDSIEGFIICCRSFFLDTEYTTVNVLFSLVPFSWIPYF